MILRMRFLLLCFITLLGANTLLAVEELPPLAIDANVTAPAKIFEIEMTLGIPFVLKQYASNPKGFHQSNYRQPYDLGFGFVYYMHPDNAKEMRLWGRVDSHFTTRTIAPILGVTLGVMQNVDSALIRVGASYTTQRLIDTVPFKNSFFAHTKFGAHLEGIYEGKWLRPGLRFTMYWVSGGTMATVESTDTKIDHSTSYDIYPHSVFLLGDRVRLLTGVHLISLGATGIVSKNFAFGIDKRTVVRWVVGAGIEMKPFIVWAKVALVNSAGDELEHFYRAPTLANPYLLAPQTAKVELTWQF